MADDPRMYTNFYTCRLWLLALAYAAGEDLDLELLVAWPYSGPSSSTAAA